ncbi:MAG: DUF2806 domain-containing protein [Paludibacteraceae bacterium]|nr:DUF2806 domain-containing protein [Paludibacteraceae bacterium]
MGDLVIDGKPLEKLLDVVSNAIGALCAPWQTKRVARAEAEADRIKAIESAKTEALLAENAERYMALSSVEKRIVTKEVKRQNNIDNVVAIASQSLEGEKEVSSERVNPDWATRFFDIAQDISDEAMQDLWGRILAGEVKRPQSYSLRTLEALRNITREEAELFEKAAQYVLYDGTYYLYRFSGNNEGPESIEYSEIARLVEIGLLQAGSTVSQNYYNPDGVTSDAHLFYGGKYVAFIKITPKIKQLSFPIYSLSKAGEELYKLILVNPDVKYFEEVLRNIQQRNKSCSIKYAKYKWLDTSKEKFEYDDESITEILPQSVATS